MPSLSINLIPNNGSSKTSWRTVHHAIWSLGRVKVAPKVQKGQFNHILVSLWNLTTYQWPSTWKRPSLFTESGQVFGLWIHNFECASGAGSFTPDFVARSILFGGNLWQSVRSSTYSKLMVLVACCSCWWQHAWQTSRLSGAVQAEVLKEDSCCAVHLLSPCSSHYELCPLKFIWRWGGDVLSSWCTWHSKRVCILFEICLGSLRWRGAN